jgi:hypothetical protein
MNWNLMDRVQGTGKYFNLFFILFIVMLNISLGFANPMIDNFGHIGGLIYGFFLIFIIQQPTEPDDGLCCNHKTWFWISLSFLVVLFVMSITMFYTVRKVA